MLKQLPALFLILAFLLTTSAVAHGGEPRLEIFTERTTPGSVVDVRGVDFTPEGLISLYLVGAVGETLISQLIADAEGGFLYSVQLPSGLAEGDYYFRAVSSDHDITSPSFIVWGTAELLPDDPDQRDDDDGLLAPMPVFPSITAVPTTSGSEPALLLEESKASPSAAPGLLVGIFSVAALTLAAGVVLRKRSAG